MANRVDNSTFAGQANFNPCSRPIVSGWPTQCIGQSAQSNLCPSFWQLPETIRFQTVELTLNIPSSIEMVSTFIFAASGMLVRVSLLVRQRWLFEDLIHSPPADGLASKRYGLNHSAQRDPARERKGQEERHYRHRGHRTAGFASCLYRFATVWALRPESLGSCLLWSEVG